MSKASLKKELATFNAEQLREIILDLYNARKEAKEYLEFFINPDIEKLNDKTTEALKKEIGRVKRRMVSPRWTRVNAILKNYDTLRPGPEHVIKIYWTAVKLAAVEMSLYYVSATFETGLMKLFTKTIEYGDKNQVLATIFPEILKYIDDASVSPNKTFRYIGSCFKRTIETYRPKMK